MAVTNGYSDLEYFKQRFFPDPQDTTDDDLIEGIITAVSRWMDAFCSRRFYRNSSDEARYYTATEPTVIYTDDIASVTSLKTDDDGDRTYEVTWATTDYDLLPYNASSYSQPLPYTWIRTTPNGQYTFPSTLKGVQVTGIFGYCTATNRPAAITEACLIMSSRIYKRKDAPFGIYGTPGLGEMRLIPELDADVQMLLYQFISHTY